MPFVLASANEAPSKRKDLFLTRAQENYPPMYYREIRPMPQGIVNKKDFAFVLDLGNHYVGKFSFSLDNIDDFISAPVRLTFRFAEDLQKLDADLDSYHGRLSVNWLQEETVYVDHPQTVRLERRYTCRYIKITVRDARRPIKLYNFCFTASSSAEMAALKPVAIDDPMLQKMDYIGAYTLKECMQTFFEDGPKRDRRMWTGDLRLQALANYYTFDRREVVKRSMYLFAAGDYDALGFLPAYIYETPYYFSGRDHIADYAMFFVCTVCDYFEHTGDRETLDELLPVCKEQMRAFENVLDERGIVKNQPGWFAFIDWCEGLEKMTALQGVYLYTLELFMKTLEAIGDTDAKAYEEQLAKIRKASKEHLFDAATGTFVNADDKFDKSVHSQVWMILGGVVDGEEGKKALYAMLNDPEARQPFTPYMQHYVVEAMLRLGLREEAKAYMTRFWGGMVEAGVDTFHEAYVPGDPDFSPYGDHLVDSLCHAWSCTPTYLIRRFFL